MNALFVTPSESGTGEAITARYIAERLKAGGHGAFFLASPLTAGLLRTIFHDAVTTLTSDRERNHALWHAAVRERRPDVVVFADYPLLFLSSGTSPLASERWVSELAYVPSRLVTLDHLGYAQRPRTVYFGPPHLGIHAETFPAVPPELEILLPCPIQEPGVVPGRTGVPVRYWDAPLHLAAAERAAVRRRWLASDDDYLIVHSTPGWAVQMAARLGLPHYAALPALLERYLAGLPRPATVVSVNDGSLLPALSTAALRVVNVASMAPEAFDALLLSADLVLTDNKVSVSLAKAVCGIIPAVVLRNSFRLAEVVAVAEPPVLDIIRSMERERLGSVFPHDVFPLWSAADLEELGSFSGNRYADALVSVELFGGEDTRRELAALLTDEGRRHELASRQRAYVASMQGLPAAETVLACARECGARA